MNSEFENVRKKVLNWQSPFKSWSNLSIQQAKAQEGASYLFYVNLARSTWNIYRLKNSAYFGGKFAFPSLKTANFPGISCNPKSRNAENNIRNAWDKGHLKDRSDFVICHDTLNNSIAPHKRTNDNRPCDVEVLVVFWNVIRTESRR